MSKSIKGYRKPTHEEIAAAAQRIYEAEGRPEGRAMEHWLGAEAQLVAQRKAEAGVSDAKTSAKPAVSWERSASRPNTNLRAN
jgi:Protein of unknown function (DUF2934)